MKQYTKDGVVKTRNRIVIKKDDCQIINPTEEQLLEDGWQEYVAPEVTEEELLQIEKRNIKQRIVDYDTSNAVNEFTMHGMPIWLDKNTRAGLMLRFQAEQAAGEVETTLWYEGVSFNLKIEEALQLLYAIERYASACYDNTQKHLANVNVLETREEIESYDYTTGYPEKLNF